MRLPSLRVEHNLDMKAEEVLKQLPEAFRSELIATYSTIISNFAEHRWEPAELNAGKFCEVVYSILEGELTGSYAAKPFKPKNMFEACQKLEKLPASATRVGDHSLRVLIPRSLPALYDVRNNRGVGHVGGDVDPNKMDATFVLTASSWILAELVRIFHSVSPTDAQSIVDSLVERRTPLIWDAGTTKRVLDPQMSAKDQVLLLLHQTMAWCPASDLCLSVEYSSVSMMKKRVLTPLHTQRLIEFDVKGSRAKLSPKGTEYVESKLLKV